MKKIAIDRAPNSRYKIIMNELCKVLPNGSVSGCTILDIGDFKPHFPLYLKDQGALVTVLDIGFTEKAKRLYYDNDITMKTYDLNEARNERFDVPDHSVDIVFFLEVIEHLKCSPKYVFKELERVMKPDGLLVLGTPNAARLSSRLRFLCGRHPHQFSLEPFYFGAERFLNHRREYLIDEINAILNWEGFDLISKINFNGSIEDHHKQNRFLSCIYLFVTLFFPRLRWLYMVIARKARVRSEIHVKLPSYVEEDSHVKK